jgi:hypothetical protein
MTEPGVCMFCRQVMRLSSGCTAVEAAHTVPFDGDDEPCRDCGAHPGNQHHPGCCVAVCTHGDGGQALFCDCDLCSVPNAVMWEVQQVTELARHPVWDELGQPDE